MYRLRKMCSAPHGAAGLCHRRCARPGPGRSCVMANAGGLPRLGRGAIVVVCVVHRDRTGVVPDVQHRGDVRDVKSLSLRQPAGRTPASSDYETAVLGGMNGRKAGDVRHRRWDEAWNHTKAYHMRHSVVGNTAIKHAPCPMVLGAS